MSTIEVNYSGNEKTLYKKWETALSAIADCGQGLAWYQLRALTFQLWGATYDNFNLNDMQAWLREADAGEYIAHWERQEPQM